MITAVEVKQPGAETGFGFQPSKPLLRRAKNAPAVRSEYATYASEMMLRQHRTHVYTIYIAGQWARIFRWDRNGAIISQPIDMKKNLKQLLNVIYRLAAADPKTQGFDPTASLVGEAEIERLRMYVPSNRYLEEYKNMILDNMDESPIFKVCIFSVF